MNLFDKAKKTPDKATKPCAWCLKEFRPDARNEKRGWAKCCSKSCATYLRNMLSSLPHQDLTKEIRDIKLRELGL